MEGKEFKTNGKSITKYSRRAKYLWTGDRDYDNTVSENAAGKRRINVLTVGHALRNSISSKGTLVVILPETALCKGFAEQGNQIRCF